MDRTNRTAPAISAPVITLTQNGVSSADLFSNLKFDEDGIVEVQRKLFGTLHNTYSFFVLYANIDKYNQEL